MGELVERLKAAKSKEEQRALQIAFSGRGTKEEKLQRGEQAARYSQPTTAKLRADTDNWHSAAEQIYGDQRMAAYLKAANPGVDRFYRGAPLNRPSYTPGFGLSQGFIDYTFGEGTYGDRSDNAYLPPPQDARSASTQRQDGESPSLYASPWQRTTAQERAVSQPQAQVRTQQTYDPRMDWASRGLNRAVDTMPVATYDPRMNQASRGYERNRTEQETSAILSDPMFGETGSMSFVSGAVRRIQDWSRTQNARAEMADQAFTPRLPTTPPGAVAPLFPASIPNAPQYETDRIESLRESTGPRVEAPQQPTGGLGLERNPLPPYPIYDWQAFLASKGVDPNNPEQMREMLDTLDDVNAHVWKVLGFIEEGDTRSTVPSSRGSSGFSSYANPYYYTGKRYGGGGYSRGYSSGGYSSGGYGYGGYGYGGYGDTQYNRYATSLGPVRWRF